MFEEKVVCHLTPLFYLTQPHLCIMLTNPFREWVRALALGMTGGSWSYRSALVLWEARAAG